MIRNVARDANPTITAPPQPIKRRRVSPLGLLVLFFCFKNDASMGAFQTGLFVGSRIFAFFGNVYFLIISRGLGNMDHEHFFQGPEKRT